MNKKNLVQATTKSRQAVMDRLNSRIIPDVALPKIDDSQLERFDDKQKRFAESLEFVGGQLHTVDSVSQIEKTLNGFPAFADAKRIASLVPSVVAGNMSICEEDDPHLLAKMDWAIVEGEFAVAENGAIWVPGRSLPHRVMLFITQFLVIVVKQSDIVDHMHDAYDRIGKPQKGFGVFVSGPSKTADIEQSLVLGAHGCRNLHVFLTP